jgi:tRNA pseudouridine38-40 synthase
VARETAHSFRLNLEYEGTRYRGFQEQKNARTVGGELRAALEAAVGAPVELGGAGRTDAGVHAMAQVAHLRLAAPPPSLPRLVDAVNERLPPDIHLLDLAAASPRFHARHDARQRSYVYQIARRRTALAKRFVWWVRRPLDSGAMAAAATALVGAHDFARFCEKPEEQTSTRVVVERVEVAEAGDLILVRIAASHFLWKMVRRLVGALAAVGSGELGSDEFRSLLMNERSGSFDTAAHTAPVGFDTAAHTAPVGFDTAAHTAPPSGLFLERVLYDGDAPLGALAAPVPVAATPRRARAGVDGEAVRREPRARKGKARGDRRRH